MSPGKAKRKKPHVRVKVVPVGRGMNEYMYIHRGIKLVL